jgi:hypothetical protein
VFGYPGRTGTKKHRAYLRRNRKSIMAQFQKSIRSASE